MTYAKSIEKFQRSWNIGPGCAFTEVRFGSQGGEFLSDGDVDELIERRIFRFSNTAQFLQERWLKSKGKITLSHDSNLQNRQRLRRPYRTNPKSAGTVL